MSKNRDANSFVNKPRCLSRLAGYLRTLRWLDYCKKASSSWYRLEMDKGGSWDQKKKDWFGVGGII